jgi:D-beta-D-heptose 7-phosphate kinase/D-beta-D-heptose 1-phosphate adenosyltransferase
VTGPRRSATALHALVREREAWARQRQALVFTNGCFDLLHAGHVQLLESARACGEILVVGLNGDRSVRELKGAGRPFVPEAERAETLLALEAVDRVVVYDEATPLATILALRPDVLVKGADWAEDAIVGRAEIEGWGGRVVRVELVPGRSTTALAGEIRSR